METGPPNEKMNCTRQTHVMSYKTSSYYILTIIIFGLSVIVVNGQTVNLTPIKDCTIFQGSNIGSNGAGSLFAGRTIGRSGTSNRRALVKFDISGIPVNATITSVTFSITGTRGNAASFSVHLLTADWGEGSTTGAGTGGGLPSIANNGDATWDSRMHNQVNWTTPGGDFVATASVTDNIGTGATTNFSSANLLNDVQAWVNGSTPNHGWIIIGSEGSPGSAVRMNSREAASSQPTLTVTYTTCDAMITLAGNIASGTYNASREITATGTIASSSTVIFNSAIDIILDPEFTVHDGGDLTANIQNCN